MKNTAFFRSTAAHRQQGVVLVTAVMLMIALTIVVLSIMRTSLIEERIVGNSRDWNNAFQAAEAALRDAEREVMGQGGRSISGETGFEADCSSSGLCLPNECSSDTSCQPIWIRLSSLSACWRKGGDDCGNNTVKSTRYGQHTNTAQLPGFGTQPRYIIEAVKASNPPLKGPPSGGGGGGGATTTIMYRITAVGFGLNTTTRVMLQSTVRQSQ